jgi:hypothetical protein
MTNGRVGCIRIKNQKAESIDSAFWFIEFFASKRVLFKASNIAFENSLGFAEDKFSISLSIEACSSFEADRNRILSSFIFFFHVFCFLMKISITKFLLIVSWAWITIKRLINSTISMSIQYPLISPIASR